MIMQQPDSQEISLPDQSVLSKLRENWRIIVVILLICAIIMIIIIGVYYATSLDDKNGMIVGLVILFSCIPLGIVCVCGIVFFVRCLKLPLDPSSDQEVSSASSQQVPARSKPEAVIPPPAPCDRQKNFERRTLQGGMDRFINRSRSHRRPADVSDSDAVKLEHKATKESPNYIFRQTDGMAHGFYSSGLTDHTIIKDHDWRRARPIDNSSTEVKGYCRDMDRRELEEKQLWSRRSKHKSKSGQDSFAVVNELESSSRKISKNRTKSRSRSETRDYRNKPNKDLTGNIYLSTRRTNDRKRMYLSKEELEMRNCENRGTRTEHVSRRQSHKNEYLYETDKITRGSQKVFYNEVDDCAEINRSARYPETSVKANSEYPYIRSQTTEPTNHRQFWQRQSFVPVLLSEGKTMSYPSITSSESNMEASQYASYNSRNAYPNIPKCNADLQYAFIPESRQMYTPKERGNITVHHPLNRYETISRNVPQHFQHLPDSRSHPVQSPVANSKEYAKYLNTYRETNNCPSFHCNASRYSPGSIEEQDYDASQRRIQRAKNSIEERVYDASQRKIQDRSSINNIETYGHRWKSTAEPRSNSNGQYAFKNKDTIYPPL